MTNPNASPWSIHDTVPSQSVTPTQLLPDDASSSVASAPPIFSSSTSQTRAESNAYELLLPPAVVQTSSGAHSPSRTKHLKEYGKTGWNILKDVLKVAQDASVPLPALQAAVGGLLAIMELIDVRSTAHASNCRSPLFPRRRWQSALISKSNSSSLLGRLRP